MRGPLKINPISLNKNLAKIRGVKSQVSTYINPNKPASIGGYTDCPELVREFLNYSLTIRGLSPRSVNGYYIDLRTFLKFLVRHRGLAPAEVSFDKIDISGLDLDFIQRISKSDVYEFLFYATQQRDNAAATRARKLSSLRGFFKYLTSKTGKLQHNPVEDVEMPAQKKRLPKYLSLGESLELLNNIQSDFHERDYCMLTLFLNCGVRLSELVGINVNDVKNDTMRVVGKGNKERIIYLNGACQEAVRALIEARGNLENLRDNALFVSKRTGRRLSPRRVQQIVDDCLRAAGLDGKGYTVHKLRHTAATLLYQHGHVDLLSLKEMLGHVDVSTTEIYTHLDTAQLKAAANASPLANLGAPKPKRKGKKDADADEDGRNGDFDD